MLREASLHQMGNFGVQRLVDACARLRGVFPLVPGATGAPLPPQLAQWLQQHDGKDPLGERGVWVRGWSSWWGDACVCLPLQAPVLQPAPSSASNYVCRHSQCPSLCCIPP